MSWDTSGLRDRLPAPLLRVTECIVPGFHGPLHGLYRHNGIPSASNKIVPVTRHQAFGPKDCAQQALASHSFPCVL